MTISIEMKIKHERDTLAIEVGEDQVNVFVSSMDRTCSAYMTKSDMRRLARFILDEVKEEDK